MKLFQQMYGIFRKEFALQSRFRLNVLNRLLIGPIISSLTVGLLYSGFFSLNQEMRIGSLGADNFAPLLVFGFLGHAYLNAGYYFFSNKIMNEWIGRTLPLVWIAPCSKFTMLLGLVSVELLRCFILSLLAYSFLSLVFSMSLLQWGLQLFMVIPMFLIGVSMGTLRSGLFLLNEGKAELLDHLYLALVFTACFYIPIEVLPKFIHPICEINPAFYGMQIMQGVWQGLSIPLPHFIMLGGGIGVLSLVSVLFWLIAQEKMKERAYG